MRKCISNKKQESKIRESKPKTRCGESVCFTQQNNRNFRDMTIFYNMSLHRENIIITEIKTYRITYFIQIKSEKDGAPENSIKENNKLISINISLTSCRESNNHNVLIPTNTKFVKSMLYFLM